jgi:hypothetical protein
LNRTGAKNHTTLRRVTSRYVQTAELLHGETELKENEAIQPNALGSLHNEKDYEWFIMILL